MSLHGLLANPLSKGHVNKCLHLSCWLKNGTSGHLCCWSSRGKAPHQGKLLHGRCHHSLDRCVGALPRLGCLRAASGGILHRVGGTKSHSWLPVPSRQGSVDAGCIMNEGAPSPPCSEGSPGIQTLRRDSGLQQHVLLRPFPWAALH